MLAAAPHGPVWRHDCIASGFVRARSYDDDSGSAPAAAAPARPDLHREAHRAMTDALGHLRHLVRALTTSVVSHQRQFITIKALYGDAAGAVPPKADGETECVVVDSLEGLDAVVADICASFRDSVADLRARIARGCVVCIARRPRSDGRPAEVVGYEI